MVLAAGRQMKELKKKQIRTLSLKGKYDTVNIRKLAHE